MDFFSNGICWANAGSGTSVLFYNPGKSKFAEEKTKGYAKHIYSILDKRLSKQEYFSDTYSIADISIWPWTARYERHQINLRDYPNVLRWYKQISTRPAVIKGYNSVGEFYEIPKP